MVKELDSKKLKRIRWNERKKDMLPKEAMRQEIIDTISENRSGKRRVTVIEPSKALQADKTIKKLRVAAYCRVSTQEESQMNSFEMQCQHFKRVISENPNYSFVKVYSDEGISGTSTKNREGFLSMMEDCRAGKIDLILTKSISRFGRNIVDVLTSLEELADLQNSVSVFFESEGIGTSDGKNSLIITILSALAEMESQQKSIAIKSGIRYKMQEGIYKFSVHNTLGYYRDYTGRVKIEPAEAEIVRYIYDSFVEGATYSMIASFLTSQEILSPTGKGAWHDGTIKSILTNEKYCGDVLFQKSYVKNFKTHRSIKNNGQLTKWLWEDVHPAIIPREKWQTTQTLIKNYNPHSKKIGARRVIALPTFFRVKSGPLKGFYLIDMGWTKEERNTFISIIKNYDHEGDL